MKPIVPSLFALALAACALDDGTDLTPELEEEPVASPPQAKLVRQPNAIPGRYIVVMRSTARSAARDFDLDVAIDRLAGAHRATVDQRYTTALHGFAAMMTEADALALADQPDVDFVEEDSLAFTTATTQTNATWGLDRIDQPALPLDTSYTFLADGTGVTTYVLDSGIRATHSEFAGRLLPGGTTIMDGQNTNDCNGHGTHVAGTVAGAQLGVAKRAKVVPIRVLDCQGSGPVSGIIAGIDYVAANAQKPAVANMSLGGPASDAQDAAVRRLIASGVTVVVSAGNDNRNACLQSPARVTEAITVGAAGKTDARASFSNFGSCVDVFAPGVEIYSASFNGDNLARYLNGTSQAAPHVTGAVALYLSAHPTASPAEVAQALVARGTTGALSDLQGSPNVLLNAMFVDTTAPVVGITSPANGAIVEPSFEVLATATDSNLATVKLSVDGQVVDTATSGPFAFQVANLAPGVHQLELAAVDLAGQLTSSSVTVTVSAPPPPSDEAPVEPTPDEVVGGCAATGGAPSALMIAMVIGGLLRRRRMALSSNGDVRRH